MAKSIIDDVDDIGKALEQIETAKLENAPPFEQKSEPSATSLDPAERALAMGQILAPGPGGDSGDETESLLGFVLAQPPPPEPFVPLSDLMIKSIETMKHVTGRPLMVEAPEDWFARAKLRVPAPRNRRLSPAEEAAYCKIKILEEKVRDLHIAMAGTLSDLRRARLLAASLAEDKAR